MKNELKTPPGRPVEWTIAHRDGRVEKATALTAWRATELLHWAYMDIIHAEAKW